jgi:hypothetical protein
MPPTECLVVRRRFSLADGTSKTGNLTLPRPGSTDIGTIQLEIITPGTGWFWCGVRKPSPAFLSKAYAKLAKDAASLFPVNFAGDVELAGGSISGTLGGFMYMDLATNAIHEIR